MNPNFIYAQIRKYNKARRQTLADSALTAVGIHVGILDKKSVVLRDLTPEERARILFFLKQFCESQGVHVEFKRPSY